MRRAFSNRSEAISEVFAGKRSALMPAARNAGGLPWRKSKTVVWPSRGSRQTSIARAKGPNGVGTVL